MCAHRYRFLSADYSSLVYICVYICCKQPPLGYEHGQEQAKWRDKFESTLCLVIIAYVCMVRWYCSTSKTQTLHQLFTFRIYFCLFSETLPVQTLCSNDFTKMNKDTLKHMATLARCLRCSSAVLYENCVTQWSVGIKISSIPRIFPRQRGEEIRAV